MSKREYIKGHVGCLIVSIAISIVFVLFGIFRFNGFVGRLIESFRDLGLSAAYYFCDIFEIPFNFVPTVNEYPKIPFFTFMGGEAPAIPIPKEIEQFIANWGVYWDIFFTKDNFLGYLSAIGDLLLNFSRLIIMLLPFFIVFRIVFAKLMHKQNNNYNKDSKPLRAYKRLLNKTYYPVKNRVINYVNFLKETRVFLIAWVIVWLCYFNIFTIIIEFLAYYLYFVVSFDITSLYKQAYKLLLDVWGLLMFFPLIVWVAVGIAVLGKISRSVGYARLRHNEAKNCGVVKERGVVTIVYGEMGAGKTALITDMALSENNILRDQAFEIILECDMKFPKFPWINFENELKRCFYFHEIYSIATCKQWVAKKKARFEKIPVLSRIFAYDYELYGTEYNDNLKLWNLWEILEQYACAYLIYTVQSSYLVSTYSIRSDSLMNDLGNFPLWNKDFFDRDARLQESYSRHAHILDFDMLRLGKTMIENNPNAGAFGFGVYVISEIDKERKNTIELQEVKRNNEECNQKNDLFNTLLKMARHNCVIANRVFVKVFADLQRPSSLGADVRELGEVIRIVDQSQNTPVLPFYSPFWWFEGVYLWLYNKFCDTYLSYRHTRGDNTLFMTLFKNLIALMNGHYVRVYNTFGCANMNLVLENGTLEGVQMIRQWYKMPKKVYSNRYCTDCFSSIFEKRAEDCCIGLEDLPEYEGSVATWFELQEQHSFFQRDLQVITEKKEEVIAKEKTVIKTTAKKLKTAEEVDLGFEVEELLNSVKKR